MDGCSEKRFKLSDGIAKILTTFAMGKFRLMFQQSTYAYETSENSCLNFGLIHFCLRKC